MWPRARRRPQQRNIDFLQKIIVCPCILSNLSCSSVQFTQLFWPCILSIFQFLKFSTAKWFLVNEMIFSVSGFPEVLFDDGFATERHAERLKW